MQKNIGNKDARVRVLISAVLIIVALLFVTNPYLRITLAIVAGALAATAYLRTCFLYTLLGKNTCPTEQETSEEKEKPSSEPAPLSEKAPQAEEGPENEETTSEKPL